MPKVEKLQLLLPGVKLWSMLKGKNKKQTPKMQYEEIRQESDIEKDMAKFLN